MKFLLLVLSVASIGVLAQGPQLPAGVEPGAIVAEIEGRKYTAQEMMTMISAMDPRVQGNFLKDPQGFLGTIGLMVRMERLAVAEKIDQQSPYKEQLELQRMVILSQAKLKDALDHTLVTADDVKKYYQANEAKYRQVRLKTIYIAFTSNPQASAGATGKRFPTEAEALVKAKKILADLRGGADFTAMVKEHSDDVASKAKDGEFATLSAADTIDSEIRDAVFSLKKGDLSEPVRQPNGFYIFRAEETGLKSLAEVNDSIFMEIQQTRNSEWVKSQQSEVKTKILNPDFFKSGTKTEIKNPFGPLK
jgi:peptidyl-prolyl cis-trans isomerase C